MKLETSEEQVARGVAAIEREWPASVSEPYPNMPAVTLRPGEKPVELDDLVRTVLAAAGPPAPPLPAEVEEMRGRILVALLHAAIRASNDEGHKMAAYFDSVRDEAASLLSRWPGGWRPIETAPKDGTKVDLFFPLAGRQTDWQWEESKLWGETWLHKHKNGDASTYPNQQPTHWQPIPEPPNE